MASTSENLDTLDKYPGKLSKVPYQYVFPTIVSRAATTTGAKKFNGELHKSLRATQYVIIMGYGTREQAAIAIKGNSLAPLTITPELFIADHPMVNTYAMIIVYTGHIPAMADEEAYVREIREKGEDIWPGLKPGAPTIITKGKGKNSIFKQALSDAYGKYKKDVLGRDSVQGSPHLEDGSANAINQQLKLATVFKLIPPQLPDGSNVEKWMKTRIGKILLVQIKYDGVRMMAAFNPIIGELYLWSRNLHLYPAQNFSPELEILVRAYPKIYFDLEAYKHGVPLQRLSGSSRNVKGKVKVGEDIANPSAIVQDIECYIFDIYDTENPNLTQMERYNRYIEISKTEPFKSFKYVKFVPGYFLSEWSEIEALFNRVTAEGYEGLILKDPSKPYEPSYNGHHTKSSVKYKNGYSAEFQVTGWESGKGKFEGLLATWNLTVVDKTIQTAEPEIAGKFKIGESFNATPKVTEEQKKIWYDTFTTDPNEFAKNYKGKYATVEFFNVSEQGKPTQPRFVAFRDYEGEEEEKNNSDEEDYT